MYAVKNAFRAGPPRPGAAAPWRFARVPQTDNHGGALVTRPTRTTPRRKTTDNNNNDNNDNNSNVKRTYNIIAIWFFFFLNTRSGPADDNNIHSSCCYNNARTGKRRIYNVTTFISITQYNGSRSRRFTRGYKIIITRRDYKTYRRRFTASRGRSWTTLWGGEIIFIFKFKLNNGSVTHENKCAVTQSECLFRYNI